MLQPTIICAVRLRSRKVGFIICSWKAAKWISCSEHAAQLSGTQVIETLLELGTDGDPDSAGGRLFHNVSRVSRIISQSPIKARTTTMRQVPLLIFPEPSVG